ncbi:MAG TPA: hypothetical protein VH143_31295 [Kofleriaceae bacterium]|jgi:hypothetical protein|nr:hypothetical protein [Kofleriaceae bacterium]
MNQATILAVLDELALAADALADTCDREAPDYGPVWHALAKNARALKTSPSLEDLADLLHGAQDLFAYRPGSFSEVYVQRTDPHELVVENEKFDALRARVSAAVGALKSALSA